MTAEAVRATADTREPGQAFGPETAQKLLKANQVNIGRKLAAGKTLTAGESALLQSIAGGDPTLGTGWVKNQVELADALGVNRKTIQRWFKQPDNPGARADGRMSVGEWRRWAQANGHRPRSEKTLDKAQLEAARLLKQNELLQIRIDERRGELIPRPDVVKFTRAIIGAAKVVLNEVPSKYAPQLPGLSLPEIERRLQEAVDEALALLSQDPTGGLFK